MNDNYIIYTKICQKALVQDYDSVFYFFNFWLKTEHHLDSIQRVFIDTDLKNYRESKFWALNEDSLKKIYLLNYPDIKEKELGFLLWKWGAEDQKNRTLSKFVKTKPETSHNNLAFDTTGLSVRNMKESYILNLVMKKGWLSNSMVGFHGSKAAFLIIQHSSNNKYRKKCLEKMEIALKNKDMAPIHYAMMLDRYLIDKHKKQLYGTQLGKITGKVVNGVFIPDSEGEVSPIKDEKNVNQRRKELGLIPLEEELKQKWGIIYVPKSNN